MKVSRAWAAGFFDGEGHVGVHVRRPMAKTGGKPYPIIQVAQNNPESLERFRASVKASCNINGPYDVKGGRSKPMYSLRISGHTEGARVAKLLWPWLGTTKREQFRRVGLHV
jgi:hypothetical protein